MKKVLLISLFLLLCVNSFSQRATEQLFAGVDKPTIWEGWGSAITIRGVGDYTDHVFIAKYCISDDHTQMRINVGDNQSGDDCAVIGICMAGEPNWKGIYYFYNNGKFGIKTSTPRHELDVNGTTITENLLVTSGNVGIGTENPQNKLDVNGTIRAKEILVESNWADFVFKQNYKLPTLREVEEHIKEKGTLPNVPSEEEVKANGVSLGKTNALLLQKIEELTLYVIQQQKAMEQQQKEIEDLKTKIILKK